MIYSYINTRENWKNSKLCENTPPCGRRVSTQFLVFSAKFQRNFAVLWWVAKIHISQWVSESVSHSVNFPGGATIHAYFVVYFKYLQYAIFQNFETVSINTTTPTDLYAVVVQACKIEKKKQIVLNNIFRAEFSSSFLRNTPFVPL